MMKHKVVYEQFISNEIYFSLSSLAFGVIEEFAYVNKFFQDPDTGKTRIKLPSGARKTVSNQCRAMVGIVAGGGRIDKPLLKAGNSYHKYKVSHSSCTVHSFVPAQRDCVSQSYLLVILFRLDDERLTAFCQAKRHEWPRVRGVAMNPVEHPFGGGNHQHIGKVLPPSSIPTPIFQDHPHYPSAIMPIFPTLCSELVLTRSFPPAAAVDCPPRQVARSQGRSHRRPAHRCGSIPAHYIGSHAATEEHERTTMRAVHFRCIHP
jgi:hypothetical protein